LRQRSPRQLVDSVVIFVRAGSGGAGSASLRREKYLPRGGPDGGDGGNGGNVYIRSNPHRYDLSHLKGRKTWAAGPGHPGRSNRITGKDGSDLFIDVPPGTLVIDMETHRILGDVIRDEEELLIASGGIGGTGNARKASPTHRCPREADEGKPGEERTVSLLLKLMIDIALIGPPNVGKSTLLAALTHARPRIEDWPFSTTTPVLGAVLSDRFEPVVIGEIPALVSDSASGKGLGNSHLAHAERAILLVFVVPGGNTSISDIEMIQKELAEYGCGLEKKPWIACPMNEALPESTIEQLPGWLHETEPDHLLDLLLRRWRIERAD
jgi:GTP-binding protein